MVGEGKLDMWRREKNVSLKQNRYSYWWPTMVEQVTSIICIEFINASIIFNATTMTEPIITNHKWSA